MFTPSVKVRQFLLTILVIGLAHGLYRGVQDNYLAQIVHIDEFERGLVEFFRELPGLFLILILAAFYRFSETRVFKIGAAITLLGILGLLVATPSAFAVVTFMVLYSVGEHIIMPVQSTLTLHLAKEGQKGRALGIVSMMKHGGNIFGFLAVTVLFFVFPKLGISEYNATGFKIVFAIAAVLMAGAVIVSLVMKDEGVVVRRNRLYFHRKFNKYLRSADILRCAKADLPHLCTLCTDPPVWRLDLADLIAPWSLCRLRHALQPACRTSHRPSRVQNDHDSRYPDPRGSPASCTVSVTACSRKISPSSW